MTEVAPAAPEAARHHFAGRLSFETDCADVHASLREDTKDFVLVDVRSPKLFAQARVPGAINIPYAQLNESALAPYSKETLFVVYCAGPHCNGANKGALRIANTGRPVKEMIGGMTGWREEGFEVER